jgi:Tfp pilus assembly PilM family ATPase
MPGRPEIVAGARAALIDGASRLAGELRISLDYFGSQEGAVAIEEIVICGGGSAIAGLADALSRELGYGVRVALPSALAGLPEAEAARITLSYGLGMDG